MALNIIPASQPLAVSAITFYLYADPGLGKTSLGFTASNAISFDFDKGSHRTGALRRGAVVPVQKWSDVANLTAQDLAPFNTVVIDTVGAMLESIKTHLLDVPQNRQKDGSLKLKAQGLANQLFKQYINRLLSFGKDVVFIAHAVEDSNNDQIIYRPDLGGKNRNEIYRIADMMGYLTTVTTVDGKPARVISFKPSPTHHAKNSGNLGGETGEVWVPDLALPENANFLAKLIQQAKDHINTMTPEQRQAIKHQEDVQNWQQRLEEVEEPYHLNEMCESLVAMKEENHPFYAEMRKMMIVKAAQLGFVYDKEKNQWLDTAEQEIEEKPKKSTAKKPKSQKISEEQRDELQDILDKAFIDVKDFCEHYGIDSLMQIKQDDYKNIIFEIEDGKLSYIAG